MKFLSVLLLVAAAATTSAQVPEGCIDPPSNNALAALIVQAIEAFRPFLVDGIPSLGIPPLDPLGPLPRIPFHVDSEVLKLDGNVNDTTVRNLAQFFICQMNMTVGISQKFEFEFRLDNFHMDGTYDVDGIFVSLFPIFGTGPFRLDTFDTGFSGGAKVSYNPISDHASIKNLHMDIFFETLELEMEGILGGGDLGDIVNQVVSEIGGPLFSAVWDYINPILASALEDGINEVLKNVSISDIISPEDRRLMELGNANDYIDLVMNNLDNVLDVANLDPALLPSGKISFGLGEAELYNGQLTGLTTLHRDGTCTVDKVADWLFLYANIAVENLGVHYTASVEVDNTGPVVEIEASIRRIAIYFVARADVYSLQADIDQFIITEFGHIDVKIDGLGLLDYVVGPLTEAVANFVKESVSDLLETSVKEAIQDALNETPWSQLEDWMSEVEGDNLWGGFEVELETQE